MKNTDSNKNYMSHAKMSLMTVAGIHALILAYTVRLGFQAQAEIAKFNTDPDLMGLQAPTVSAFDFIPTFSMVIIIVAFLAIQDLRREKLSGWLLAIGVFCLATPSWAMLAAGYGLYCLLQEPIREKFLKQLSAKVDEI